MKHIVVSVYHQDCYGSITSEKFPTVLLEQFSPVGFIKKNGKTTGYQLMWKIDAPTQKELDDLLKHMKDFRTVKEMRVIEREPRRALVFCRAQAVPSYDKVMHEHGVIPTSTIKTKEGLEEYSLLAPDPSSIQKVLAGLNEVGEVKVRKIGEYVPPKFQATEITDKQLAALNLAMEKGYYEWPRRVTLEELAEMERVSRRCLQERLRRAETKLIPKAIEDLLKEKKKGGI